MKNYSRIIERECSIITNTLATVHQDLIVEQQQSNNNASFPWRILSFDELDRHNADSNNSRQSFDL